MTQVRANYGDTETAYAKVNLALHVREKLADGYHQLETIFAFLDDGDRISVEEAETTSLSISGPFSEGLSETQNLVLDAASLLEGQIGKKRTAKISLEKNLPVASGIGGGSADAAATLRLLNRWWSAGLDEKHLLKLSASLGADVPACVMSRTCRGTGIGQELTEIDDGSVRNFPVLLVNPLQAISTKEIFANWNGQDRGGLMGKTALDVAKSGRNDLASSAKIIAPKIGDILEMLGKTNAIVSRMSGSGATCFGLYEHPEQAKQARSYIQMKMPATWTMLGWLR